MRDRPTPTTTERFRRTRSSGKADSLRLYRNQLSAPRCRPCIRAHLLKTSARLSTFDRIGVAVVAFLGACLGCSAWETANANDMSFPPAVAVILPGAVIGFAAAKFVGRNIVGI